MSQEHTDDELQWLKALIEEGLASGVIEKDAKQVLREIVVEFPSSDTSSC